MNGDQQQRPWESFDSVIKQLQAYTISTGWKGFPVKNTEEYITFIRCLYHVVVGYNREYSSYSKKYDFDGYNSDSRKIENIISDFYHSKIIKNVEQITQDLLDYEASTVEYFKIKN